MRHFRSLVSTGLLFVLAACFTGCVATAVPDSSEFENSGSYLDMRDISKVEMALSCEKTYRISGDPYRVSQMAGLYCVDGLAANFRVVKIYESPVAAKLAAQDYESIQTGGRKLVTGKNWFLLGLTEDAKRLDDLKLESRPQSTFPKPQPLKDNCMLQLTSLIEAISQGDDEKGNFALGIDAAIPGALIQANNITAARRLSLAKALESKDPFLIEQELAEAAKSYREFCSSK